MFQVQGIPLNVNAEADQLYEFEDVLTQDILGMAWRYSCRLCRTREDAEDLLQDALAHAMVRLHQLRDRTRFKSWLMSIVRTRFLMNQRRLVNEREKIQQSESDPGSRLVDYSASPEGDAFTEEISATLTRLPEFQREILTLFYIDDLNLFETAHVLAITVGAVQQRLFRARGALKRELERSRDRTTCVVYQEL